ncbi:hypothetical protein AB0948_31690 [Streptomyces koyangensis]|uniref:hypothetical protein n=1 Tax=Streptomyces koyangensis TaxID=188770 RepID=UPI00345414CF
MHSSYLRFPADVPSAGRRVVLCLRVRRFFCCCVRTADVCRAATGPDPAAQPVDRAPAFDAGRGRPGPGRPGRRPDGTSLRGVRRAQHGVAAAHGLAGAGGTVPTGGRRR